MLCYLRKEINNLLKGFLQIINKANREGIEINSPLVGNINLKRHGEEFQNKPSKKAVK